MRLWYLHRAVPWTPLVGCLLGALAMSALTHRWPAAAGLGMPCVALLCAAAAGLVHDEPAAAVAAVTPRAGWAAGSRSSTALLPLVVSLGLLVTLPARLHPDRGGMALVGTATVLIALGAATLAAAEQRPRPGGAVAAGVILLGLSPLPVGALLDVPELFPLGTFPDGLRTFWIVTAGVGLAACLVPVLRPSRVRRRTAPARRPARRRPGR